MSLRTEAPYQPQDAAEVLEVVKILSTHHNGGAGGFKVRKKTYKISDGSGRTVDSWSMNDWDYKKPNLPTYARGLFTHRNNGHAEIAVRGYDKFFNINEVRKTEWHNIEQNTRGPYELSVKENGCIIFIAGLDDKTLIVTSKHSTGEREDASANHALAGEAWVDKQLQSIGKTREEFAKRLRELNITAVAELCDDDFEEHVLQYTPEQAGLYLHGVNLNLPEFATYPSDEVAKFADGWGFRRTQYIVKDSIAEVRPFLENVAQSGAYDGRDTEGFVIRCQARETPQAQWVDWFFKFKFEEPYLMYRQWREVTRSIIANKVPKIHKHKKITEEYIIYARRQLAKNPNLGTLFNQNHGIIAMRDGFLAEKGLQGHEIIRAEEGHEAIGETANVASRPDVVKDVLLVPIATIGCGKTTIALALAKIFGWGHEQNDNIDGKNRPKRFTMAITNSLGSHAVVVADRNNHQRRERAQIIADVRQIVPRATFVALHWIHDGSNMRDIKQALQHRVLARGDNHQTIHPASKGSEEIIGIMNGFVNRFEPADAEKGPDQGFDLIIDLDPTADSRQNLATVIKKLHDAFPNLLQVPTEQAMDEAIQFAFQYKPNIKHDLSGQFKNKADKQGKQAKGKENLAYVKPPQIEFFGIYVDPEQLTAALDAVFAGENPEVSHFYNQLKSTRRVQKAFHVTLIHRASKKEHPEYWQSLNSAWEQRAKASDPSQIIGGTNGGVNLGAAQIQLESVVWDDRLMAIKANIVGSEWASVNAIAHITVGTASDDIKPKESNDLLAAWASGQPDSRIKDIKVKQGFALEGAVRGIISRM